MANLTRRGIAKELETSPYIFDVSYNDENITFYFSSKLNRKRFEDRFINARITLNRSLENRYKLNISLDVLSDILLYRKIEHRGFLIKKDGELIKWQNSIKLDGHLVILKNLDELSENLMLN